MYLFGESGHAKVIIDILKAQGIEISGLVDDNPDVNELQGYPVKHDYTGLSPFIVSIGSNAIQEGGGEAGRGFWASCPPFSHCIVFR